MVKIRLSRQGAKHHPYYRIIAIDSREKRDGRPLEYLGTFDPNPDVEVIQIKRDRVDAWIAKGAQPSPAVRSLMRRAARRQPAAEA